MPMVKRFWGLCVHVAVNGDDLRRSGVLGAEAVTTGVNGNIGELGILKSGNNVEIKGLADGAGLLGAVENAYLLDGFGHGGKQMLNREGTIEVNLDKADLFAVFVEIINGLFDGVTYRTHGDDDLFGVSCAVVVKELIFGAELCVDSLHIILNNADSLVIINVGGLSCLEENIRGSVRFRAEQDARG